MVTRARAPIWIAGVAAVLIILGLSVSLAPRRHTFRVRNSTAAQLTNVIITLAGSKVATGPLGPGDTVTVRIWSRRGDGLSVQIPKGSGFHMTTFEDVQVSEPVSLDIAPDFTVSLDARPAV